MLVNACKKISEEDTHPSPASAIFWRIKSIATFPNSGATALMADEETRRNAGLRSWREYWERNADADGYCFSSA